MMSAATKFFVLDVKGLDRLGRNRRGATIRDRRGGRARGPAEELAFTLCWHYRDVYNIMYQIY
jgi:hypothetical protein